MKNFEYAKPRSESQALELLSPEQGDTVVLAGGTDLVGLMKKMTVDPDRVVDVKEIPTLRQIERLPTGQVLVGAAVNLDDFLAHRLTDPYPSVKQAIQSISSIQLQAQGTVGGELLRRPNCWYFRDGHGLLAEQGRMVAEGDNRYHAILGNRGPAKFVNASRLAPALISLGAQVRVVGPGQQDEQYLPLEDLFQSPRNESESENVLQPGQLLTHVLLPADDGQLSAAYEVRHGEGPDPPLAAAAATMRVVSGIVREARIVLGHVAPIPWISTESARCITGTQLTEQSAKAAGVAAVAGAMALSENEYKIQLARVAVERSIKLAAGLPTGGF